MRTVWHVAGEGNAVVDIFFKNLLLCVLVSFALLLWFLSSLSSHPHPRRHHLLCDPFQLAHLRLLKELVLNLGNSGLSKWSDSSCLEKEHIFTSSGWTFLICWLISKLFIRAPQNWQGLSSTYINYESHQIYSMQWTITFNSFRCLSLKCFLTADPGTISPQRTQGWWPGLATECSLLLWSLRALWSVNHSPQ